MATQSPPADATLFNNPFLSDIKIRQICGDRVKEYFGHKAVLCCHSKWFMRALTGGFKEASESVIEMHDDNPDHFEIMLKNLYTKRYRISEKSRCAPQLVENFIHPIGVHLLADKYEVEGLCSDAVNAFGCPSHWSPDDCVFKLDVAGLNEMVGLHYGACEIAGSEMGNCIVDFLFEHGNLHTMTSDIKRLVHEFPAFGADIVIEELRQGCLGSCTKRHR